MFLESSFFQIRYFFVKDLANNKKSQGIQNIHFSSYHMVSVKWFTKFEIFESLIFYKKTS